MGAPEHPGQCRGPDLDENTVHQAASACADYFGWSDTGDALFWTTGSTYYRIELEDVAFERGGAERTAAQTSLPVITSRDTPQGRLVIASYPQRAKVRNARRHGSASVLVLSDDFEDAWVHVVRHPFFAVTGEDGAFGIGRLPPGTYGIEAWHEKLGTRTRTVAICTGLPSRT